MGLESREKVEEEVQRDDIHSENKRYLFHLMDYDRRDRDQKDVAHNQNRMDLLF